MCKERFAANVVAIVLVLLLSGSLLRGQNLSFSRTARAAPHEDAFSFRCGVMYGRSGIAGGPSMIMEADRRAKLWGLRLILGKSRIDGYPFGPRSKANAWDSSIGSGFVIWPLRSRRFRLGGFVQAVYFGDRTSATFPDGYGGMGSYYNSENGVMLTAGPDMEYQVAHGVWIVVYGGKNWMDGIAAHTWHGATVNGGFLVDPMEIGHKVNQQISFLKKRLF